MLTDSVRDVTLTPSGGGAVQAGDEVSCSAHGNPEPMIDIMDVDASVGVTMPQIQEASGRRYFNVPSSWVGQEVSAPPPPLLAVGLN